jgi:hypothetical protein
MRTPLGLLILASAIELASIARPARAAGADPAMATPVQREQAQARFLRGKQLFQQKKYDEALIELKASLDIVASPNTRLQMARTLRALNRLVEAYVELGRVIAEAKEQAVSDARYEKADTAARVERKELEPQLGFVTLSVQNARDETTVHIAKESLSAAAWSEPAPVMPGPTEIVVETPGHAAVRTSVVLRAGEKKRVSIDAGASGAVEIKPIGASSETSEGSSSALRPLAYVAGGIGVAGLATFTIAGLSAKSTYNDLQSTCRGPCPPDKSSEISSGRSKQTIANVGLALGIAGVVAGATLFVISMPKTKTERAALVVGPTWIGVRGTL